MRVNELGEKLKKIFDFFPNLAFTAANLCIDYHLRARPINYQKGGGGGRKERALTPLQRTSLLALPHFLEGKQCNYRTDYKLDSLHEWASKKSPLGKHPIAHCHTRLNHMVFTGPQIWVYKLRSQNLVIGAWVE